MRIELRSGSSTLQKSSATGASYPWSGIPRPSWSILVAWRKVLLSQLRQPREEYDLRRA